MTEASSELNDAFNPSAEEGTPEFTLLPKGAYVASIVDAVALPLIVDGETGFGGLRNMRRTMRLRPEAKPVSG